VAGGVGLEARAWPISARTSDSTSSQHRLSRPPAPREADGLLSYVDLAPRDLAKLDQYDFALICADRSLHIIELKRPDAKLIERHRSHYIVSEEIHKAVSQCLNYLRALDEQGPAMQVTWRNERGLDIDFRRAKATVVIGRSDHAGADVAASFQIQQTIRSYNAHLSRIEVTTYSELLDSADQALRFEVQAEEH
jgi:hypothetical protein